MAHAFASDFPGMAGNLNGDVGQNKHVDYSQALHGNGAVQNMSSMYADHPRRSVSTSVLQRAEFGMNGVSGLPGSQQNWHPQQPQVLEFAAQATDYDTFLANNGLGVKSQRTQPVPGMPPLSRGSAVDFLTASQQNGTVLQRRVPNAQQMFANMTRSPSTGQLPALKPYLLPGMGDEQSVSRSLHAGVPMDALLPQSSPAFGQAPLHSDVAGSQGLNAEAGAGKHLVSHSSGLNMPSAGNMAAGDIQQLLNNMGMGNYPASAPEHISRPSSRASNAGGPVRHASGCSTSEMLAAQHKGSPSGADPGLAGNSPPNGNVVDAPPPAVSELAPEVSAGGPATSAAEAEASAGVSAFAAVANMALDDEAPKEQETAGGQPPATTISTMAGSAPLAPNVFDPSYAVPPGNSLLTNQLMDPAAPAAAAGAGRAARAPELLAGISGNEMAMMQQLQQQLGGNASYNEILEAMRLNGQQQALAQQRLQAAGAGSGTGMPGAGNMPGMGGLSNQDILKQAERAGIMGRQAMLQQLNKGTLPQQQHQPLPGRATPPHGGLPYGLSDPRLSGDFANAPPKPQPSPQQMRFGGNIGVHAINRTSSAAGLPVQQQVQNRAMLGGLGLNANPLTAGLAGTMAGAPRPGLKPNWQAQRVQSHAQAAVAAQQAAQVQQVQAMRLAAAKAQAQAQLNAQLHAQVQAAQAQANRTNLLAGLTPAQLQMLMNAPPQQLNQMAAQLGLLDNSAGVAAGMGGRPSAGLAGIGMTQQQKLMAAAAAARGGYAPPPPQQRQAARPMLTQQQQLQQLYAQQAAQQAAQARMAPSLVNSPALAGLGGMHPGQNNLPQPGGAGGPTNTRAALLDMGRGLAQAGFTVEHAVNSGLLGGFSAFDVRALSEGHQAELVRIRAARAAAAQQDASMQQQVAHQQLLRQSQLQQLQQAQQAQAAAAAAAGAGASQPGSDAGSQGGATPKTPAPVMNLGPGSLGQLFDWQPNNQGQQQPPAGQAGSDLLSGNWDLTSTQLLGGLSGAPAPAVSLGGLSGPIPSGTADSLGPIAPRAGSDAGGSEALFPPTLRSRSPWEGAGGNGLGVIQPSSARSGVSSHATTPRSRPGTMSSLLEMGSVFGPPPTAGQQPPVKYSSQGSLDGELPSHLRAAPGAQAPIGEGRLAKSGQGEVPANLRAFWENGGLAGSGAFAAAPSRPLGKSISLDSAQPPPAGAALEPAKELEDLDAALEAAANAANAANAESGPALDTVAPADLGAFTASSYSFFEMNSMLGDTLGAMGTLSLEGELEAGNSNTEKAEFNSAGLDDTGMTEVAEDSISKSAP